MTSNPHVGFARKYGFACYTKEDEYRRSMERFEEIYKEKGLYFALAFLYDLQYGNSDLLAMIEILKPGKGRLRDMMQSASNDENDSSTHSRKA